MADALITKIEADRVVDRHPVEEIEFDPVVGDDGDGLGSTDGKPVLRFHPEGHREITGSIVGVKGIGEAADPGSVAEIPVPIDYLAEGLILKTDAKGGGPLRSVTS